MAVQANRMILAEMAEVPVELLPELQFNLLVKKGPHLFSGAAAVRPGDHHRRGKALEEATEERRERGPDPEGHS